MSDVVDTLGFDGDGRKLWSGTENELPNFLGTIADTNTAVAAMANTERVPKCSKNDVMRTAEEIRFISRQGMPRGFLATLPEGKLFEASIDAFNVAHLDALNVNPIDFPLIFDSSSEAMSELIDPYLRQGRTFALADRDNLMLSYAADPNLFSWLKGRRLDRGRLPYAIYSPQPVFRNFRTGELSIQRTRQFGVPDIHILSARESAADDYLHAVELAAESTRFWFGNDYVHVLDSVVGSANDTSDFYARAGKATGGITVVRRLAKRPKYYAQKTGMMVWSGYDNVMLYNLQMDEVNPVRFDIQVADGDFPTVIHACVAMGLSRMLPLLLGRGISGITTKTLPIELSPTQVTLIPIGVRNFSRAKAIADELQAAGLRISVDTDYDKLIGTRLGKVRKAWQSKYVVIGDREMEQRPLIQDVTRSVESATIEEFNRTHGGRIRRCAPALIPRVCPFPFSSIN